MPNASSNIQTVILYSAIFSEFLRIARCSLLFRDFLPRAVELFARMKAQGGVTVIIFKQIEKAISRYPCVFSKYEKTYIEIRNDIESLLH